jgi:hypothetical protein
MRYTINELKQRLRELKKLECRIRFKDQTTPRSQKLVWDTFFATQLEPHLPVKYPLERLLQMSRAEFKMVVEEYFYQLYFQKFQDTGLTATEIYDPQLLALLGLPPYAGMNAIKHRFRELAKQYHPDCGGDSEKFIELMEIYVRLKE